MTISPIAGQNLFQARSPEDGAAQEAGRPSNVLEALGHFAAERGLEVRLRNLPNGGATIIQFVDPRTDQVVREFPSEQLTRVLAAIRTRRGRALEAQA